MKFGVSVFSVRLVSLKKIIAVSAVVLCAELTFVFLQVLDNFFFFHDLIFLFIDDIIGLLDVFFFPWHGSDPVKHVLLE